MTLNNGSMRNGLVYKESHGALSHTRQGSGTDGVNVEVNKSWQVKSDTQTATMASEVSKKMTTRANSF